MSEGASTNRIGPRLDATIAISIFVVCLVGLGAWGYWTRWHDVPPPGALQIRRPAARAAVRLDSTAPTTQNVPEESSAPQRYEGSPSVTFGSDYEVKLGCFEHPRSQIKQKLIAMLAGHYPGVAEILSSDYPQQDPKVVRQVLDRLLEAAKNASPEKKPPLLLAADAVGERLELPSVVPPNAELQRQLDGLAARGLTFTWIELDGGWFYDNNLLWRLWREYPASEEGEDAFVLLLRRGWDKGPCCKTGLDSFHTVIEQGEEFLSHRPQSAHRQEVLFLVAQAYETWWSLSLVSEENREEGEPSPSGYRQGAPAAREKALAYYGEIVGAAPDGVEANCSRTSLALMNDNEDTHQRRFYCYCD